MKKSPFAIALLSMLAFGAAAATADSKPPSDAQIAAIVVTANQVDIDAGKLAASKSTKPEVKTFAERMVSDHGAVNAEAKGLVARLKVSPEDSSTSASLQAGGDENLAALRKLSGAEFDRAYVEHEIAYHQQVIDALDSTLIPGAQNAELKALLVKVRPSFVSHLEHARHLQKSLAP